jgi:membrane associated rhomboid family serine protease
MALFRRQTSGSVVCPSCGRLVGVKEARCSNCGRPHPGLLGFGPLLRRLGQDVGVPQLMVGACVLIYLLMLVTDLDGVSMTMGFNLLGPSGRNVFLFGASGWDPVLRYGRWWTVLSAGWLHGGLLHVGFNMMWAWQLLPPVIRLYGAARTVIVYLIASVTGFLLSTLAVFLPMPIPFLQPAQMTLGASAAILGLLGALVYYGRRAGSSMIGRQALSYAVMLIVFGFVMSGVDNWAHLGGFGGGWLAARWLDPLRPERADHVVIALVLLLLSAASIVVSIVHGLPMLAGASG